MDVIVVVVEVPPGEALAKHIHPGEEIVYVLQEPRSICWTERTENYQRALQ